jgi:hypothetical protein
MSATETKVTKVANKLTPTSLDAQASTPATVLVSKDQAEKTLIPATYQLEAFEDGKETKFIIKPLDEKEAIVSCHFRQTVQRTQAEIDSAASQNHWGYFEVLNINGQNYGFQTKLSFFSPRRAMFKGCVLGTITLLAVAIFKSNLLQSAFNAAKLLVKRA